MTDGSVGRLGQQPGFPDPGLALDDRRTAFAMLDQAAQQAADPSQFALAVEEPLLRGTRTGHWRRPS